MAQNTALKKITSEAKAIKKRHPHKFDHMRKKDRWPKGYVKQASAAYNSGRIGKSPVKKKAKKKVAVKRRKVSARKPVKGKHLVKYVERASTERVMSGRRKKRSARTRKVHMAGTRRRRSVSGTGGNMGLLLGLGVGALALYLLTKKSAPSAPITQTQLPQVTQTGNYTRDSQSNDILNYALAAGIGINAISSLIDKLNTSSDSDVSNIYDNISTTGDVGAWV